MATNKKSGNTKPSAEAEAKKRGSPGGPRKPGIHIDDQKFIQAWETSSSVAEAAEKLGVEVGAVQRKAAYVRRGLKAHAESQGLDEAAAAAAQIKEMRHGPRKDYMAIAELIASLRS